MRLILSILILSGSITALAQSYVPPLISPEDSDSVESSPKRVSLMEAYRNDRVDLSVEKTITEPLEIATQLQALVANRKNFLQLEAQNCHQTQLSDKIDPLVRVGFYLSSIIVKYAEHIQTRFTTYRRLFHKITLKFQHVGESEPTPLVSSCSTQAWQP